MKKFVIVLGLILLAAIVIRRVFDPVAKLARDLDGPKGASAAMALADMGRRAEPAVPALLRALQSKNEYLRLNAALALGKIGKPAVEPLRRLLSAPNDELRYYALAALGWIGPDAAPASEEVADLLVHKNPEVRGKALHTMTLIVGDADQLIAPLIQSLADRDNDVCNVAIEGLVKVGPPAIPALIPMLNSKHQSLPALARRLLRDIDPDGQMQRILAAATRTQD